MGCHGRRQKYAHKSEMSHHEVNKSSRAVAFSSQISTFNDRPAPRCSTISSHPTSRHSLTLLYELNTLPITMSAPGSSSDRAAHHSEIRKRSYAILDGAREAARKKDYDSQASRNVMAEECLKRTGFSPRAEQLDLAECMLLGVDAVSIAGTGWGKTMPFVLPLFVPQSKGKIVVIISPLNALESDQVRKYYVRE